MRKRRFLVVTFVIEKQLGGAAMEVAHPWNDGATHSEDDQGALGSTGSSHGRHAQLSQSTALVCYNEFTILNQFLLVNNHT